MALPARVNEVGALGGTLLDWTNAEGVAYSAEYACITGSATAKIVVKVNDVIIDTVFIGVGGSHSWWQNAGGRLLPEELRPGQRLVITSDVGPVAIRIDWRKKV